MGRKRTPKWRQQWRSFADFQGDGGRWTTSAPCDFFPDYLPTALDQYEPAIAHFGILLGLATDSRDLFRRIMTSTEPEVPKITLVRIFRRYVSPESPVELLKRAGRLEQTLDHFGDGFRPLDEVKRAFQGRPLRDEALGAVLWEHQERGKPGAALTATFFEWVRSNLQGIEINGGRDIPLSSVFADYPKSRGVDFVMKDSDAVIAVGFLHYDSD